MKKRTIEFSTPQEGRAYALLGFMLSRLSRIEAIHHSVAAWRDFPEERRQQIRDTMPAMAAARDAEARYDTRLLIRLRHILAHGLYVVFPDGSVSIVDKKVWTESKKKRKERRDEVTIDDVFLLLQKTHVRELGFQGLKELALAIEELTSFDGLKQDALEEILHRPRSSGETEKIQAWLSERQARYYNQVK